MAGGSGEQARAMPFDQSLLTPVQQDVAAQIARYGTGYLSTALSRGRLRTYRRPTLQALVDAGVVSWCHGCSPFMPAHVHPADQGAETAPPQALPAS